MPAILAVLRSIAAAIITKIPGALSKITSFLTGAWAVMATKWLDVAVSAAKSIGPQLFEFAWKIGPTAFIAYIVSQIVLPYFSAGLSFFFYTVNAMFAFALAPLISESAIRIVILYVLGLFFFAVGIFAYSLFKK